MKKLIFLFILAVTFSSCQQVFFWLTTITAKPTSEIVEAPKSIASDPIPSKNDISILIYKENNMYAYIGTNITNGKRYDYASISNLLKERKKLTGKQFIVFIKAGADADYNATVKILDQMTINDIKKYTMTEPTHNERAFIKQIK